MSEELAIKNRCVANSIEQSTTPLIPLEMEAGSAQVRPDRGSAQVRPDPTELNELEWCYGVPKKYIVLCLLTIQNAGAVLLMRYTRSIHGENNFNPQVAVFMQEAFKALICIFILLSSEGSISTAWEKPDECVKTAVPSLLYLLQNNLQYIAIGLLDAATYTISYQSKTIWSGLFSVMLLGRQLESSKYVGLVFLGLGVGFVQMSNSLERKSDKSSEGNKFTGFAAILAAAAVSSFAGVYFEKILKGVKISLWARNLQLAFFSLVLAVLPLFLSEGRSNIQNIFHGFTPMTWLCISMNAGGGLLVGCVIKYADAVTKDVAIGASILLSSLMSIYLFNFEMHFVFAIGGILVVIGVMLYGSNVESLELLRREYKVLTQLVLLLVIACLWFSLNLASAENDLIYAENGLIYAENPDLIYSTRMIHRKTHRNNLKPYVKPHACIVSAMLGGYEKTAKGTTKLDGNHSLFMIVDDTSEEAAKNSSIWTPVRIDPSWWADDCLRFEGAVNNPCKKQDPFMMGKFAKTQAHRLDVVRDAGCNVVVWMDGSLELHNDDIMSEIETAADKGLNLAVFRHGPDRNGEIYKEVQVSHGNNHYKKQPIDDQYKLYVSEGFKERWFDNHTFQDKNGTYKYQRDRSYGMYVTCMVLFDFRDPVTEKFLDCWWEETVRRSTQDQISFPYCAWKLGIDIPALPDGEIFSKGDYNMNKWYKKLAHNQR